MLKNRRTHSGEHRNVGCGVQVRAEAKEHSGYQSVACRRTEGHFQISGVRLFGREKGLIP